MNQVQQVVHGMNQTGRHSVNPIKFPLTQVNVDAVRAQIQKLSKHILFKKDERKLRIATEQLEYIEDSLQK